MSYHYEYDDCSICGGQVSEKLVEKISVHQNRIIAIIQDVPAGVCEQCGERYYRAEVVKHLEKLLSHTTPNRNHIQVPVKQYAA